MVQFDFDIVLFDYITAKSSQTHFLVDQDSHASVLVASALVVSDTGIV